MVSLSSRKEHRVSTLVGFYQDQATAEAVQQELRAAGFRENEITLLSLSRENTSSEEPGFWHDVKSLFGYPGDSDEHLYKEAARQGLVPVIIDVDDDSPLRKQANEIMTRHEPIDITAAPWKRGAMATETTEASAPDQAAR
jgi:hypothetical protein